MVDSDSADWIGPAIPEGFTSAKTAMMNSLGDMESIAREDQKELPEIGGLTKLNVSPTFDSLLTGGGESTGAHGSD